MQPIKLTTLCCLICLFACTGCAVMRPGQIWSKGGSTEQVGGTPTGWPVRHPTRQVSSGFGMRNNRPHNGVDIPAPRKAPVYATAAGRVVHTKKQGGYGRMVRIDHGNGYETWYAHLYSVRVRKGRWVKEGDVIGRIGRSGRASGDHLHYEVRRNGNPVDPWPYVAGRHEDKERFIALAPEPE